MTTMKPLIYKLYLLSAILLLVSCTAFEKEPEYAYKVYNNTTYAITVRANLKYPTIGSGSLTEVIPAGETQTLWIDYTGEKGEGVMDIERKSQLSPFDSFLVQRDVVSSSKDFLETRRWQYKKEKNYRATYTLTVSDSDF